MKKLFYLLLIAGSSALMTGCASGPKYGEIKASFPALAPDNGRIYFYRIAELGAAVQPDVKLNGEVVGTAKPEGFFYVDRPPGNYTVETSTEVKRQLSLELDKNQTRYVRLNISLGFFVGHVYAELVEDAIGEKEITDCHYTGSKP
jgi:Protein of unknown function (DUF2846)